MPTDLISKRAIFRLIFWRNNLNLPSLTDLEAMREIRVIALAACPIAEVRFQKSDPI